MIVAASIRMATTTGVTMETPGMNSGVSNLSAPVNSAVANSAPMNSPVANSAPITPLSNLPNSNLSQPMNSPAANSATMNSAATNSTPITPLSNLPNSSISQPMNSPALPNTEALNAMGEETTTQANYSLPPIPMETTTRQKVGRSQLQAEADQGQAEMLARLRNTYAQEFANIPEKFRPKPKAYVARAAYYKPTEEARNSYINQWLKKDRAAAEVRMGTRKQSTHLLSIAQTRRANFHPSAAPLKEQAVKAKERLEAVVERAERKLLARAPDSKTRKVARELVAELRKQAAALVKEARRQATELEHAAKRRLRQEAGEAFATLESQASKNLAASLGRPPPKTLSRRLAHKRNSGAVISANTFLSQEESRGRYSRKAKGPNAGMSVNYE